MRLNRATLLFTAVLAALPALVLASGYEGDGHGDRGREAGVQLGPRPFFLVDDMTPGPLKTRLQSCAEGPFSKTDFSIGHRGAALQFPEHTKESYEAGARMGAGILECDVTFTRDKELVCRHSQCDLHTTTNILATPLATKCSIPFAPTAFEANGNLIQPASATCCTSAGRSAPSLASTRPASGQTAAMRANSRSTCCGA